MALTAVFLAFLAASFSSSTNASPTPGSAQDLVPRQGCQFSGPFQNFPPISQWVDFNTMFNNYRQTMLNAGDTPDDVGRIAVAIENASSSIGVDQRVILGIIMQESTGFVGAICTGNNDCGLMQCEGCPGFPGQNGLPQEDTSAMVNGGTQHYKGNLRDFGDLEDPSSIYPALREYNSGSVVQSDLSSLPPAPNNFGVPCYVSDVARRLMGEVF